MRKNLLLVAFILLVISSSAYAACTGSSPNWQSTADRTSVAACVSSASSGDTINVAAGSASWTSAISITKPLSIIGAGGTNTAVTANSGGFSIDMTTTSLVRISGIYFTSSSGHHIEVGGDISQLVIDNCRFDNGGESSAAINLVGYFRGTIYGNYFLNNDISIQLLGGNEAGAPSWERPIEAGMVMGLDTMYVEGNTFKKDFSCRDQNNHIESGQGGNFVVRFNTFDGSEFCRATNNYPYYALMYHGNGAASGTCSTELRGHPIVETYNNKITGGRLGDMIFRGGSNLIFNNTMDWDTYTPGIELWQECGSSWPSGDQIFNSFIYNNTRGSNGSALAIDFGGPSPSHSADVINLNRDYRTTMPKSATDCVAGGTCGSETLSGPVHGLSGMTSSSTGANAYYPYTPFTCPHPLAAELSGYTGSCVYATAGTDGYNVGDAVPTVSSTSVGTNGTTVSMIFSEPVTIPDLDAGELNLDCSVTGNNINLSSPSGSGTSWSFTAASTIQSGEVCNLDFTGDAGSIIDATSNSLATFNDAIVTNNSIQGATATYHWVSTTQTAGATWSTCVGATDPSVYCSLAQANAGLTANQKVYLKAGTYNNDGYINPTNSGTPTNPITYESVGGTVTITGQAYGIRLVNRDYIYITGPMVISSSTSQPLLISNSDHNIIDNVEFNNASDTDYWGSEIIDSSTYNWIKNCTFHNQNLGGVLTIGTEDSDADATAYNLIESSTIYNAEHTGLALMGRYNTVRNCLIQNYDGHQRPVYIYGSANNARNLFEGNRVSYAPLQTDNTENDNVTFSMSSSIFRYNVVMKATGGGLAMYRGSGYLIAPQNNAVYNNTIWGNDTSPGDSCGGGIYFQVDTGTTHIQSNAFRNNILYGNLTPYHTCSGTYAPLSGQTFANNYTSDPIFTDATGTDPTVWSPPDLTLQSGSGAIDYGAALTTANGAGSNSTALTLAAGTSSAPPGSNYFQDGTFAPSGTISADWIAIGTVDNVVQISSINYSTNVITLAAPMTWSNGASVWLYKKSDGTRVLFGAAPDAGAFEYGTESEDITAPQITIENPDPTYVAVSSLAISGAAYDAVGVTSCKWRLGSAPDDSNGTALSGTATWSGTVTGLSVGANTVYAGCTDDAGNWGSESITVNYNPPSSMSIGGTGGATFSGAGSTLVTYSLSSLKKVYDYPGYIYIDGSLWTAVVASAGNQHYQQYGYSNPTLKHFAIRFSGVTIPEGATIIEAKLQCVFHSEIAGDPEAFIYGLAEADPSALSAEDNLFTNSGRWTTANAEFSPYLWADTAADGTYKDSPDITSVVQELVDLPGYAGDGMVFLIYSSEVTGTINVDVDDGFRPKLFIKYIQ